MTGSRNENSRKGNTVIFRQTDGLLAATNPTGGVLRGADTAKTVEVADVTKTAVTRRTFISKNRIIIVDVRAVAGAAPVATILRLSAGQIWTAVIGRREAAAWDSRPRSLCDEWPA